MRTVFYITIIAGLFLSYSCKKEDIDDEPPVIDISGEDAFIKNCDTIYRGETFNFKATFTDNQELGAFSINIHHNFDHHTHTTEIEQCELDPPKEPTEDVFVFIESYDIPSGIKEYSPEISISVPSDVDKGDYHFFISLTDAEGWQTVRGLGIKILDR